MNDRSLTPYSHILFLTILLISTTVFADYSQHPKAAAFIDNLVTVHQFEREAVVKALAAADKKQSILDAIARPAEKTKPWHEYRRIFLGRDRVQQGVAFWQKYQDTLARAARELQVDPAVIVAVIGVETRYGRHTGSHRVIDALTTLGFDYPPRADFFRKELEYFFLLAREQQQDLLALKGSYAGAMGYGQFIPSSVRAYAIDFDDDGVVDIWNNPVDAIGSVANYFQRHGWQQEKPVFARTRIALDYNSSLLNGTSKPALTVTELREAGYEPVGETASALKAMPLSYDGIYGKEFWLGFNNFYVITRYNRSQLYAMAVWQLSEEIHYAYQKVANQ